MKRLIKSASVALVSLCLLISGSLSTLAQEVHYNANAPGDTAKLTDFSNVRADGTSYTGINCSSYYCIPYIGAYARATGSGIATTSVDMFSTGWHSLMITGSTNPKDGATIRISVTLMGYSGKTCSIGG